MIINLFELYGPLIGLDTISIGNAFISNHTFTYSIYRETTDQEGKQYNDTTRTEVNVSQVFFIHPTTRRIGDL